MPRIPFSLASGEVQGRIPLSERAQPGVWALPGRAVQDFGAEMERTSRALFTAQQEQAKLEAINLSTMFDSELEDLKIRVQRLPDPLSHELEFVRGVQEIGERLGQQTESETVRKILGAHTARKLQAELPAIRKGSLALFDQGQLAWLETMKGELSKRAVEASNESDRDEAIGTWQGLVSRFESRGLLDPVKAQQTREDFAQRVLQKRMDFLRRTDRDKLYKLDAEGEFKDLDADKRFKVLDQATRDDDREQANRDKNFKEAQRAVESWASAEANFGRLSDSWLEDALRGRHPFITPDRARELKKINESPPTGTADLPVKVIMQDYYGQERTYRSITEARKRLNALATAIQKPSDEIVKALKALQDNEYGLDTHEIAITRNEIDQGLNTLRSNAPQRFPLPGPLGQMQENQDKADEAELRRRVYKGEDKDKVANEINKRRNEKAKATPQRTKDLKDLGE